MARDPVRPAVDGFCPLCGKKFTTDNNRTKHHIFPRYWYGKKGTVKHFKSGVSVVACAQCHETEFNHEYPMILNKPWTPSQCVVYWFKFCLSKGKDPLQIYPHLNELSFS